MSDRAQLDIYMDGNCAFCQWSRARLQTWDTRHRLRFLDYNDPQVAASAPYSIDELDREMHLRSPNGTWSAGFDAWIEILRVLPGLSWMGWLLSKPPLRWMGPGAYAWIAAHRTLLPGAPPPCTVHSCGTQTRTH